MYEFLYNMWIMNRITEEKLHEKVERGRITEEEYQEIINSPKCV